MFYYLNNFLLYSIFGFLYETIVHLITSGKIVQNPFVGPWMPIYGFGIIIMIFLTRFVFNRLKMPRFLKVISLFLLTIFILTLLEELGGVITEAVFHKSFWDYTDLKFNIGKYIALEVSLGWGSACLIFLYIIKPLTDKFIEKIPKIITIILILLIIIDFICSFFLK